MEEMNNGAATTAQGGVSKYIVTFVVLIVLVLGGYYLMGGKEEPRSESTPLPAEVQSDAGLRIEIAHQEAPTDWKKYTNSDFGVEVSYPEVVFTEEVADLDLPDMKSKLVGRRLVHTLAVKSCPDLTKPDECKPTTEDIAIGLFFIKKNFGDFLNELVKQTPNAKLVQASLDGREGFMLGVTSPGGAQGIFQYFFPVLNGEGVMIITRLYVDEKIATKYQGIEDFIPYARQQELFTQVVASIKRI